MQRKNKYDSKKYRLVVRRTCSKVISQIIYSTMTGDKVLCAAESTELKAHGLTAGLTNYSACYATGLLLARRLLKQVGLADMYKPNSKGVRGVWVCSEYHDKECVFSCLLIWMRVRSALTSSSVTASHTRHSVLSSPAGKVVGQYPYRTQYSFAYAMLERVPCRGTGKQPALGITS